MWGPFVNLMMTLPRLVWGLHVYLLNTSVGIFSLLAPLSDPSAPLCPSSLAIMEGGRM